MRRMFPVAVCVGLALAVPARASPLSLRLGADALLNGGPGVFSLGLGVESALGRRVSVGARFGGLITTSPTSGGVPLDVFLRIRVSRAYIEGVGGPWMFFGAEIGFVSPDRTQLGLRIGLRL